MDSVADERKRSWGAGGATSEATTAFVKAAHADLGLETCMHLTCTNMPEIGRAHV